MEQLLEAPTFYPTASEFADPLAYIERIGARGGSAASAGLCKIVPPAGSFEPRFVRGGDAFVFRPRRQPLAELGARTRVHRLFLEDLQRYWLLRGIALDLHARPPTLDRSPLDLHALHHAVAALGGPDAVTARKLWAAVARALNVASPTCTAASSILRTLYDRWLRPFDLFLRSASLSTTHPSSDNHRSDHPDKAYAAMMSSQGPSDQATSRCGPPMKRMKHPNCDPCSSSSLSSSSPLPPPKESPLYGGLPNKCFACHSEMSSDAVKVTCSGCLRICHSNCSDPPVLQHTANSIGTYTSMWHCLPCLIREFKELQSEPYGFVDSSYDHTLHSFGIAASKFKAKYFKMDTPPSPIPGELSKESLPISLVEKEFWRLIESPNSTVEVEYGSDIHSSTTGSGFPYKLEDIESDKDHSISKNPWNLNVLSKEYLSLLPYFDDNIPGMMVPWIYVGMCFSNFCWHNEDHYTYSINYLHWGEPKTWYGVSGADTEKFEQAMQNLAPELFQKHPDLLQHLVTMVSPLDLVKQGIKVYRLDQRKGEFVITFPSAYHAGFNHGFNFAEAVNFALPDWLPWGRKAVDLYSRISRNTVFSHEELVFTVAQKYPRLCDGILTALLEEMQVVWSTYQERLTSAIESGIKTQHHVILEKVADESRTCSVCHTTCFLGCVICKCTSDQLTCLKHANRICQCPNVSKIIQYRYTYEDYLSLLSKIQCRLSNIKDWLSQANVLLQPETPAYKIAISDAQTLFEKGKSIGLHRFRHKTFMQLEQNIRDVDAHDKLGRQILFAMKNPDSKSIKLEQQPTYNITHWLKVADNFPISVPSHEEILRSKSELHNFQAQVKSILTSPYLTKETAEQLIQAGKILEQFFEVPELLILQQYYDRIKWQDDASVVNADPPMLDMTGLAMLIQRGLRIEVDQPLIRPLKILHATAERWVAKAVRALTSKSDISTLHGMIQEASSIPLILAEVQEIKQIIITVESVKNSAKTLFGDQNRYPTLTELSDLHEKVNHLPIKNEDILQQLKKAVDKGKGLVTRLHKLFHKKGSGDSLGSMLAHQLDLKMGLRKTLKERRKFTYQEREAGRDCLCHKPVHKSEYVCFVCQRLFHPKCLKPSVLKDKPPLRYFCHSCRRTTRPSFSALQAILQESKALRIQLEGFELAQEVCNVAVHWNQKAQNILEKGVTRRKDLERIVAEGEMLEIEMPEQKLLDELLEKWACEGESYDSKSSPSQDVKSIPTVCASIAEGMPGVKVMTYDSISTVPLLVTARMPGQKPTSTQSLPQSLLQTTQIKSTTSVSTTEKKHGICICHQPFDPYESHNLVRCVDCAGWFHMDCLGITNRPQTAEDFLCPYCVHRTANPSPHRSPWAS